MPGITTERISHIGSPPEGVPVASAAEPHDGSVTRSFIGLGFGEAAARLVAFVTTLVIARRLGADSLGIVAFAFAILLYLQRSGRHRPGDGSWRVSFRRSWRSA